MKQSLKFYFRKFILNYCTPSYGFDSKSYIKSLNSLIDEYNGSFPLTYKAELFAKHVHLCTNHRYGNKEPYSVHLIKTFEAAMRFHTYLSKDKQDIVFASCWLHDVIEDCRINYNDLKTIFNEEIADIVFAVTNEKGKSRKERENDKYYKGIKENELATFVKLCDRIGNVSYSVDNNSPQLKMYADSMKDFVEKLYTDKYKQMFVYLAAVGNLYSNNKERIEINDLIKNNNV